VKIWREIKIMREVRYGGKQKDIMAGKKIRREVKIWRGRK